MPNAPLSQTPVVLSWSGGKDSALALEALRGSEHFDVVGLLTTVTTTYDRISIHGVRRALLHRQATALGLPLWEVSLEADCSNEIYEAAVDAALQRVQAELPRVSTLAFGDLFLSDVRAYRERLFEALGFRCVFPLWGRDTAVLAREVSARGYEARIVCVDTQAMAAGFAGRPYDEALLTELPAHVDPCGERGEFHTFVAAGPVFRERVAYQVGEVVLRQERFAFCDLVPMDSTPPISDPSTAATATRTVVGAGHASRDSTSAR